MVEQITSRYRDRLSGILSCYDRIVITGTIPGACYAAGMTSFLYMHQIRIFDYARFAEPLRERIFSACQDRSYCHCSDRLCKSGLYEINDIVLINHQLPP